MNDGKTANSVHALKIPWWSHGRTWGLALGLVCFSLYGFCMKEFGDRRSVTNLASNQAIYNDTAKLSECRSQILTELDPKPVSLDLLRNIYSLCYTQVSETDNLTDFDIRKVAFQYQQKATGILMWMVVAITISGVLLAGVQLYTGYRLAASGKVVEDQKSQINIEAHRLSLNSSVTGVVILFISLMFFYVYVKEVYLITEFKDAPTVSAADSPSLPSPPRMLIGTPPFGSTPPANAVSQPDTTVKRSDIDEKKK